MTRHEMTVNLTHSNIPMKTILLSVLGAAAILGLPACTTVVEDTPDTVTTTTTESTRVTPAASSTTTVRSM